MSRAYLTIRKQISFAVLTVSLSTLVSLLAAEMVLRWVYGEQEANGTYWASGAFARNDSTGYVHAPGYEGYAVRPGVFKSPVKINWLSLRQGDMEAQLQYPSRVLILGDSFAFGLGVLEAESFAALIKPNLNARKWGLINGAQTGYSVEQERLFGLPLMARVKPEVVLLALYPHNDVEGDYDRGFLNTDVEYGYRLRRDRWFPGFPGDYLRTHSYLWMYAQKTLKARYGAGREAGLAGMAKRLPPYLVRPTLAAISKLREKCEADQIILGVVMIPPKAGSTPYDESLNRFFAEQRIPVLDLARKGFDEQDYFSGDGHWNAQGHAKAAGRLLPFLADLLGNPSTEISNAE